MRGPAEPAAKRRMARAFSERWALLAIVALSIVFRATYFLQLDGGSLIEQHRWSLTDMHFFDAWGRAVAHGDWLSTTVKAPLHDWHTSLAAQHFAAHPEHLVEFQRALDTKETNPAVDPRLAERLWLRWLGGQTFYQDPLYPYLVGVTYRVFGEDPRWVFLWQMLLGTCTNVLIFLVAKRCFGSTVATVAGLLATVCSPLLYYELVLVREASIACASMLVVLVTMRAIERPSTGRWLSTGVVLGLGILLKSTFFLLSLVLAVSLAVAMRKQPRLLLRSIGAAIGGIAVVLLPAVARNVAVGVAPLALASSGAITFVSHNAVDYDPTLGGFYVSQHAAKIMGDSDGKFLPAIVATLGTHSVGSFVHQVTAKFATVWHWYEIPDNSNFHFYRQHAWILYLPATFWLIGSLAVVGLAVGIRTWRTRPGGGPAWPLYLFVFTSLVSLLAFMVMSRVRLPLLVGLIPFAALGLVTAARYLRDRRWAAGAIAIGAMVIAAIVIGRPLPVGRSMLRGIDFYVVSWLEWGPRIQGCLESGDLPNAEKALHSAMKEVQGAVSAAGAADVDGGGAAVDGMVAKYLFVTTYRPIVNDAARAQDWKKAASVLGSFLKCEPNDMTRFVESPPTDPVAWQTQLGLARFYSRICDDCAAMYDRAGESATAATFASRARAIDQVLQSLR